jgi:hypothetical protein
LASHLTLDQAIGGSSPPSSAMIFYAVRSHRLGVRTPASHVGNAGSNPAGITTHWLDPSVPPKRQRELSNCGRVGTNVPGERGEKYLHAQAWSRFMIFAFWSTLFSHHEESCGIVELLSD